jgi:hypothetical protein
MNKHQYESCMINTLRGIGSDYQEKYESMIFAKNGIVLVADYNEAANCCIGSIMTHYVYSQLCSIYEDENPKMTLAAFAWSYGWGYDFTQNSNMDAIHAFQYAASIISYPIWSVNRIGAANGVVAYIVREKTNGIPANGHGIHDTYSLIGVFTDIASALQAASSCDGDSSNIATIPIVMDTVYATDAKPCLGLSVYIK